MILCQLKSLRFFEGEWFDTTASGVIRGREFPIPGGYDRELTRQYGDYMKPPEDPSVYTQHLS